MKVLIVEDEHFAVKRLTSLLEQELPEAEIIDAFDTVLDAVEWFKSNQEPDLVFMDIQLADGLSFQIFEKVQVSCPIIFITAFDEYALEAFKVNSIDYLLKPIEVPELQKAIKKFHSFYSKPKEATKEFFDWTAIAQQFRQGKPTYKQRFLHKSGSAYAYLKTEDIALFCSEDGLSFAYTHAGKRILLDQSLDKLISELDPGQFHKISRKHIVALDAISKIHPHLNHRLKLELKTQTEQELIVSREKAKGFKQWIGG